MTATHTPRPTMVPTTPKQDTSAGAPTSLGTQAAIDIHGRCGAEGTDPAPQDHGGNVPQAAPALGEGDPFLSAAEGEIALLGLLAANVDDLERTRIAVSNRLAQARRSEPDADGEMRGFGLDDRNPYVRQAAVVLAALEEAEHTAILSLQRAMRKHPLGPWVKAQRGLGEKQVARLLGKTGDPYLRPPLQAVDADGEPAVDADGEPFIEPARPRRVSDLWAYCGLHVLPVRQDRADTHVALADGNQTGHPDHQAPDTHAGFVGVAPKRQRGQAANWNTEARKRVYLVATAAVKQLDKTCPVDPEVKAARHADGCKCGTFRKVYDGAREKYADSVHLVECARCGPSGAPAPVGSPLSDAHKHARALRIVGKEVLKELWREAGRLHGADTSPPS